MDDKMLAFMDHMEGHPEVYSRDKLLAHLLGPPADQTETASGVECWTYFLKSFPPALLCEENVPAYDAYGSKPYQPEYVQVLFLTHYCYAV